MREFDGPTTKGVEPNAAAEHDTPPPQLPPPEGAKGNPDASGVLLDLLGPIMLHAILLLGLVVFASFVVPRFVEVFAGLGAPLPMFTRIVLGFSHSLAHNWLLALWLGLGLDSLLCLAVFWMGGRKACRIYGIAVAAMLILLAVGGVIALVTAMPASTPK